MVMLIKLTNKTVDIKDDFLIYPPGRAIFGPVSNPRGGPEDKNPLPPASAVSRMIHAQGASLPRGGPVRERTGPCPYCLSMLTLILTFKLRITTIISRKRRWLYISDPPELAGGVIPAGLLVLPP